jgi:hypothetical protein
MADGEVSGYTIEPDGSAVLTVPVEGITEHVRLSPAMAAEIADAAGKAAMPARVNGMTDEGARCVRCDQWADDGHDDGYCGGPALREDAVAVSDTMRADLLASIAGDLPGVSRLEFADPGTEETVAGYDLDEYR